MADNMVFCGRVQGICADGVEVLVASGSADCAGCAAAMLCTSRRDHVIRVATADTGMYQVGEEVRVWVCEGVRWRAIVMCLVLPLLLMIAVAACVWGVTGSDVYAAVGGIVSVAVYFATVRLLGVGSWQSDVWHIRKLND